MKNKLKKQNGITLISLVITVIVLLILAGITINLTIGQDGILKRAEEAGKNYTQAAEKEKTELAQFSNLTDRIIDNVTKNHYTMVDGVPVPKGFSYKEGTKDTGFVIINDTDGNEFVWVPCTIDGANESIKYDRYVFLTKQSSSGIDSVTNSIKIKYSTSQEYVFTEAMPSDERQSVQEYAGFYIGRYESGIAEYTNLDTSTSTNNTQYEYTSYIGGKIAIKPNQQVWNYITRDKAKKVSESLYQKEKGNSVNSKLCSSYAWDTALKFIETKYPVYPTNSTQGNYSDKSVTLGKPAKTGLTDAVNNIYDMGGNTWEWTTEISNREGKNVTIRGGYYEDSSGEISAAYRNDNTITNLFVNVSFRITLYL